MIPIPIQLNRILLIVVLALAFILRIWNLNNVPPGFYLDEASIGYDAFSVLQTGKDFHGHSLPFFFESFGEWKNPIYIYATVPSVALFGLDVFATRLPAALFGFLAVFALFLVARELFNEKIALLACAFLAVSPWALQFSRIAFEATALSVFFLFGLWFFLKGLHDPRYWIASAAFFALCLYTYAAARLFIPLFIIALIWIFRTELITAKKQMIIPVGVFLLISLPTIVILLFFPEILFSRANVVGIWTHGHSPFEFFSNYLQYFSPKFLVFEGDGNLRHSPPGYGMLLWFLIPLLLTGIAVCLRSCDKNCRILFAWLLLFPVIAALTYEGSPHAIRSITGVGIFELFAAVGTIWLYGLIKRQDNQKITIIAVLLFLLLAGTNVCMFSSDYFSKYPISSAAWFDSGLKDTFEIVKQEQEKYDYIVLSPKIFKAKMYATFYLCLPPVQVQDGDYGKIVQCDLSSCGLKGKLLLVKRANEPQEGEVLFLIKNVAGYDAFKLEKVDL